MTGTTPEQAFDYVIVGAGSAGSVLASRLTEDGTTTVCVLEAGGSEHSIWTSMPAALSIPMNMSRFDWGFYTEPEPHMDGRRVKLPRGKGLGGSSTINGMCYVRGNPLDYETWVAQGADGWGYADVLPYFKRAETFAGGGDGWRGGSGPLKTTRGTLDNPLYHAFMLAGAQAGYPLSADMNGAQQEGFAPMDMTVDGGKRCSLAKAYLRPAMARPTLAVLTGTRAERIEVDGRRATGVVARQNGAPVRLTARAGVVVSAGAIMSPHLLKLSGIGPAAELRAHGIDVVHDLPGVGENLTDHLELYLQMACTRPVSLYPALSILGRARIGIEWLVTRRGWGASNHFEAGGFIRSRAGVRYPDIQYHFLPIAMSSDGTSYHKGHGFQVHVGPKRSKSRGWVRLRDANPQHPPRVCFNYLSHEDDFVEMRACVRLTREIFAQPAFDPFRGDELSPGQSCQTDAQIDAFVKTHAESAYHPSATCRMGRADDPMAVVTPDLRLRGLQGLHVVDASVMPQATGGDINAPTIMIAERAADLIRGRTPERDDSATFISPDDWQVRQRPGTPMRAVAIGP